MDAAGPTSSSGEEGKQDAAAGQQADSEQAGSTAEPMQQEAEQTDGAAEPAAGELAAALAVETESELKATRGMQNGLQDQATAIQETAAAAVNSMPGLPEAAPAAAEAVVDSTQAADAPPAEVTQLPVASTRVDTTDSTSTAVVAAQQAAAAAAEADTGLLEPLPAPTAAPAPAPAEPQATDQDARQPSRAYFKDGIRVRVWVGRLCKHVGPMSSPPREVAVSTALRAPWLACLYLCHSKDQRTQALASPNSLVAAACMCWLQAIDVEVDCGPGMPCKLLHVTLDVSALQGPSKPFLGGFKHTQHGTIYHHASIQTPQDQTQSKAGRKQQLAAGQGQAQAQQQEGCEGGVKLTRQTQTVKETSCSSQTVREAATQMAKVGLLLDCSGDR